MLAMLATQVEVTGNSMRVGDQNPNLLNIGKYQAKYVFLEELGDSTKTLLLGKY